MFRININASAVVIYTNNLEKLPKSALPVAIRSTLNDTAFKLKKTTLLDTAKKTFKERKPNFFKANSKAIPAVGFDINKMVSTVAMVSSGLHNQATNYAVKDLEQQEHSGTIRGRSFKPLEAARINGTGNVKQNSRISQLLKAGNVIDARDSRTTSYGVNGKMQQFIKASIHAGVGGYVLGGRLLFQVTSIKRINGDTRFELQKLYTFNKNGVARVKASGFMRPAALEVQKEMEFFYKLQAMKQLKKAGVSAWVI